MTTFGQLEDTDIDIAIDEQEAGERRSMELATRIRMVAAQDPELAQDLVDQLIIALDKAMGGTFKDYLEGDARDVADRALAEEASSVQPDASTTTNSPVVAQNSPNLSKQNA